MCLVHPPVKVGAFFLPESLVLSDFFIYYYTYDSPVQFRNSSSSEDRSPAICINITFLMTYPNFCPRKK